MFPLDSSILKDDIKIHHTMRIMPEDQNTGGFYVALLKKNGQVRFGKGEAKTAEEMAEDKQMQKIKLNDGGSNADIQGPVEGEETEIAPPQTIKIEKTGKIRGFKIPKADYLPFSEKYNDAWQAIRELYGFDEVEADNREHQG